jgi:hypothetical protein
MCIATQFELFKGNNCPHHLFVYFGYMNQCQLNHKDGRVPSYTTLPLLCFVVAKVTMTMVSYIFVRWLEFTQQC